MTIRATITAAAILAAFMLALAGMAPAQDARRVALVIGNAGYTNVARLENPANDATDIAAALERIGFDVTLRRDLDDSGMRRALRDFSIAATGANVALIYYAGHGVQIDNTNYMIPVNAELQRDADVEFEAIRLEAMLSSVNGAQGLKLVFVDACRDNPFLNRMTRTVATRSLARGLSKIEPRGVVVGFAARDGTQAFDGQGRNSPYAAALLQHLEEPGLELGKFFRRVRDTVLRSTGGVQEPFHYGSLPAEDIFLVPVVSRPEPNRTQTPLAANLLDDFATADRLGTVESWRTFLAIHSDAQENPLVRLAARRLELLETRRAGAEPVDPPDLLPEALVQPPSWITSRLSSDGTYALTFSDRRLVQRALNKAGFDTGGVDGRFGPKTRAAIVAARAAAGLTATADVDPALIATLSDPRTTVPRQSDLAIRYDPGTLPAGLDPRLVKAIRALGGRPITFGQFESHLYVAVLDTRSWADAHRQAERAGGHLVTLGSLEEDRFVYRLFFKDSRFNTADSEGGLHGPHIGLQRNARHGWKWVTEETMSYAHWASGRPGISGLDYGAYYRPESRKNAVTGPRYWTDTDGGARNGYVIEIE